MRRRVCVIAQVVDQLGLVQMRRGTETRSLALRPTDFRRHQPAGPLKLDHDPACVVGELVALDRDRQGLWAVLVSDELGLLRIDRPVYLSAEVRYRPGGHDHVIEGASIVTATASTCTRPALVLAGDLSDERHRRRWKLDPRMRERVDEAAATLKRRRIGERPVVYIREPRVTVPDRPRFAHVRDSEVWAPPPSRGEIEIRPARIISVS